MNQGGIFFQQYEAEMRNAWIYWGTQKKRSPWIVREKKAGHIVVKPHVAINTRGRISSLNDMASLEPNKAPAPSGMFRSILATIIIEVNENVMYKLKSWSIL
jgi:hypothetical protein